MTTPLLTARALSCTVPHDSDKRTLFHNVSLTIHTGEIIDLTGPSGSGKTSLLTALARLNPHAEGDMTLMARPASEYTPQQWRAAVAYLPQKTTLTGKDVADAIRLPFTLAIRSAPTRRKSESPLSDDTIRSMLDALGCNDIELSRPIRDISGGQASRIALARTLLTRPRLLLADEVDAALDDHSATMVATVLADMAHSGMAVVRIRHRAPDGLAERTFVLDGGRLQIVDEREEQ